jgi:hypothetical protein
MRRRGVEHRSGTFFRLTAFRFCHGYRTALPIDTAEVRIDPADARRRIGRGLPEEHLQRKPQQRAALLIVSFPVQIVPARSAGLGIRDQGAVGCPRLDDLVVGGDRARVGRVSPELLPHRVQQPVRIEPGIAVLHPAGGLSAGEWHPHSVGHDGTQRGHQPFDERHAPRTGKTHAGASQEIAPDRFGGGSAHDLGQSAMGGPAVAGQKCDEFAHQVRIRRQPSKYRPWNQAFDQHSTQARTVAAKPSAVDELHPVADRTRIDHRAVARGPRLRLPSRSPDRDPQAIEARSDTVQECANEDGVGPPRRPFAECLRRHLEGMGPTLPGIEGVFGRLQPKPQQPAGLGMVTGFGGGQELDELGTGADQGPQIALEEFDRQTQLRAKAADELSPADPVQQRRRVQDGQILDGWPPSSAGDPGDAGLREYRGMTGSALADSCPRPGHENA